MKCIYCGTEVPGGSKFCSKCGKPIAAVPQQENVPEPTAQQISVKKKKKGAILVATVAVIAVIAVITAIFVLGNSGVSSGDETALVYRKGNFLYYTANMDKDKEASCIVEIDFSDDINSEDGPACGFYSPDESYECTQDAVFSVDGEYIYFFSEYETEYEGTLCRIPVSGIKSDEEKNAGNIEIVAERVQEVYLMDDGSLVCSKTDRNDNSIFSYISGTTETEIGEFSGHYFSADQKNLLYSVGDKSSSTYTLCAFNFDKLKSTELAENVEIVDYIGDDYFLCSEAHDSGEDSSYSCYTVDLNGEKKEADIDASTILGYSESEDTVYYITAETKTLTLYDFVTDSKAEEDAASEPEIKDYLIKISKEDALGDGYEFFEEYDAAYQDLLADMTVDDQLGLKCLTYDIFDRYYDNYYYMDEDDDYDYYDPEVSIDGQYLSYYDETSDQWYSVDWERYNSENDELMDRDAWRALLQADTYDYTFYNLCKYKMGEKEEVVAEKIDDSTFFYEMKLGFFAWYSLQDTSLIGGDLSELNENGIYDDGDLYDLIEEQNELTISERTDQPMQYLYGGQSGECDLEIGEVISEVGAPDSGSYLYIKADPEDSVEDSQIVYYIPVSGGKLGEFQELDGDLDVIATDAGLYHWNSNSDWYFFDGEKDTRIVKGGFTARSYADGTFACLRNGDENGAKLVSIDKEGNTTYVDRDVTDFVKVNDTRYVYRKDDELYVYADGETRRIDRRVASYCTGQASVVERKSYEE